MGTCVRPCLRAALGPAESGAAAGAAAAAAEAEAAPEAGKKLLAGRKGHKKSAAAAAAAAAATTKPVVVAEAEEEDDDDDDARFPKTQPVILLLCRVAVSKDGGQSRDSSARYDQSREGPARYDRSRDVYYAHDPVSVLPEFIITVNVVGRCRLKGMKAHGFNSLKL
jgi:hypothetical protein